MAALIDPRARIRELAARDKVTLVTLSRVVGRRDDWMSDYMRGRIATLPRDVLPVVAQFFGVPARQIGG